MYATTKKATRRRAAARMRESGPKGTSDFQKIYGKRQKSKNC